MRNRIITGIVKGIGVGDAISKQILRINRKLTVNYSYFHVSLKQPNKQYKQ